MSALTATINATDTSALDKPVTVIQSINRALFDAMEEDDKILILGEDVADPEGGGIVGVTRGLSSRFGEHRVRSTPIAEQAIIGAAIGASLVGYRPIAEIMLMNFTTVAMDMIVNHAAKLRYMSGGQTHVPIVIRCMTGAGRGNGGQHSDYLEAWFAHTAGMKVITPATATDAYGLMRSAIDDPDPVLVIENLPTYWTTGPLPEPGTRIPIGQAKVVKEGSDVTLICYARMVHEALAAVEAIEQAGVSIEIVDLRSIQPWDREAVFASVTKTGRAIIVHEAVTEFGVGAEIAAQLSAHLFGRLKAPIGRIGAPFTPVPYSKALEALYVPNAARITEAAISLARWRQ